jgi:hypothetical protein
MLFKNGKFDKNRLRFTFFGFVLFFKIKQNDKNIRRHEIKALKKKLVN